MHIPVLVVLCLVSAAVVAGIISLITGNRKDRSFEAFLIRLKKLLVLVLIGSAVMLLSLSYQGEISEAGFELKKWVATEASPETATYIQGELVVTVLISCVLAFVISAVIRLLEIVLGAIGRVKSANLSDVGDAITGFLAALFRAPVSFVLNLFLALVLALLVATGLLLLEAWLSKSYEIRVPWQSNVVIGAWIGALAGYGLGRSVAWVRRRLETNVSSGLN
jgi:hypothetical protein